MASQELYSCHHCSIFSKPQYTMANNRLYLKCKRTGEQILLAKYYPSTGWYSPKDNLIKQLNDMLERDSFPNTTHKYAEQEGIKAQGGMYDAHAHELVYEEEE